MTTSAIIMMIIAMLTLWGGLIAATLNLAMRKDATHKEDVRLAEQYREP